MQDIRFLLHRMRRFNNEQKPVGRINRSQCVGLPEKQQWLQQQAKPCCRADPFCSGRKQSLSLSAPVTEPVLLSPVIISNIIGKSSQGIFNILNEIGAARCQTAEAYHRVALGIVIGYSKHFAVRRESM